MVRGVLCDEHHIYLVLIIFNACLQYSLNLHAMRCRHEWAIYRHVISKIINILPVEGLPNRTTFANGDKILRYLFMTLCKG